MKSVGIIGARGHVGSELVALLAHHPEVELRVVASRALAGQSVPGIALQYEDVAPSALAAHRCDAWFLALPSGEASPYVEAVGGRAVVIDLSADYRFDRAWRYGLPELRRGELRGAQQIANPGCYATGMQLAIAPFLEELAGPPTAFGVSGYSGAGTTPSPRNDPERLRDNLMPYQLVGHLHEREVSYQLHHPVQFLPHVAGFFRGISLTISLPLLRDISAGELHDRTAARYQGEPLLKVQSEAPLVADQVGRHGVSIGGFIAAGRRAVLVATLDNLLKGAATQALQNLNLALGFDEWMGITT